MLDANSLAAIALEARTCFLEEDAPEYLEMLRGGINDLQQNLSQGNTPTNLQGIYKELGRAAHSIKGGAGMAEMPSVSALAHKIEDLFEALQENRVTDLDTAIQLLVLGVDELENLIQLETNSSVLEEDNGEELVTALEEFLKCANPQSQEVEIGFADDSFIKNALANDLSECIARAKEIVDSETLGNDENTKNSLNTLLEECQLLGQALNCNWLVEISQTIKDLLPKHQDKLKEFSQSAIAQIEQNTEQFLENNSVKLPQFSNSFLAYLEEKVKEKSEEITIKKETKIIDKINLEKPPLPPSQNRNLRIPIQRVNKMGDVTGQLLILYEKLSLYESQIKQTSFAIKKRTKLLGPIKEQLESFYDRFSISEKEKIAQTSHNSPNQINPETEEFDALEFDQYSQIHTTLQDLTELIIQIQEIREDFDIVEREYQETLIDMRGCLDTLDEELRQVRLVPFINLAGGFIKPLEKMNKTYHKSVELVIKGEETLIDQNIVETLRTPFNHIIRNAFDHGIETPEDRKKLGKPIPATISLGATVEGNNVLLTITDDGGGINLEKVYQKAKSLGLFSKNKDFNQLTRQEILGTIFSPGFSTASQVTDLSGRGVGMDIVKAEIEKLRGTIEVDTEIGKGTKFKLKIPMALNIISLLLVKINTQIVAIPSENVLRVIRLSDYEINDNLILWENQKIPFHNLLTILPYHQQELSNETLTPYIGLLLKIGGEDVILGVDAVVDEKALVTKSLSDTVAIPAYLGGYTVLGSGSVVPILVPDYFKPLLSKKEGTTDTVREENQNIKSEDLSILVIDDSVAVRRTLNRILTQMGYKVTPCRDGKEAWNTLQNTKQHFDLAICDLEMPGFDGYKVLQLVRISETWHDLPMIILTSRDNDLHRQKAMDLGANAYLTKPFNPVKIVETIQSLT